MDGSNAGSPRARVGCEGLDAAAPACHERRAAADAKLARSPTATEIAQHAMIAGVPLVDAAGLAALRTAAAGAAARAGVDLRLATGQPFARRVVARSRLGSRLVCR
jgi:hypothetical protein